MVPRWWITAIPGDVIDYEWIYRQIDEDAQRYDLQEIGFDRWGGGHLSVDGEPGHDGVQIGQGYASMSAPMKEVGEADRLAGWRMATIRC